MRDDSVRVACVGAGYFAQAHYAAWRRIAGVTLLGACDLDRNKAVATGLPAFADLETMLAEVTPDLLDVILPPAAQGAALRAAIAAGVRTVICQKPFCRDPEEAEAITTAAEQAGTLLIVHENVRFQPWYRAIGAALQRGDIGTVLQATFRLRPGDGQGPEAYLDRQPYFRDMPRFLIHETGVHWIDTFRYLFGSPCAVYADLRRLNPAIAGEDAGLVILDHDNGLRATFDGNRHLDHAADNLRRTMGEALIEGTTGTLTLTGDGAVHLRSFGSTTARQILAPDTFDGFGGDCVYHLQAHVIDALAADTPPENTARDYLQVLRIEQAIYQSAQSGRKIDLAP